MAKVVRMTGIFTWRQAWKIPTSGTCPICGNKYTGCATPSNVSGSGTVLYIHEENMEDYGGGLLYLRGLRGCKSTGEKVDSMKREGV